MAVNLHATHYRFGVEELLEATHGWHAALDTNPAQGVIANDTTFLLRFTVQETGGTAAANTDQQFQCRKNAGTWQDITTTSTIVKAVASVAFTNGQACTKRLTGTGTFESSGAGCTEDGSSGGPANDIAASGNSETECGLLIVGADVAGNDVIEFRLTSPDFPITNDVVPTITVAGATIVEADGNSAGVGASSVAGSSVFAGVTAAAGVAASVVVGAALWVAVSASAGLATLDGVSGATSGSPASASGIASDAVVGASVWNTSGASVGAGLVSGVGAYPFAGVGSAAGVASDAVTSGAVAGADGASTGVATVLGTATNTESGDGSSSGSAAASGVGAWLASSLGESVGAGAATGVGRTAITGVTKTSTGLPLGACTVQLFQTSDDTFLAEVVSSAAGVYALYPDVAGPFYLVAYKAGSPDVAGTTVNTLVAV